MLECTLAKRWASSHERSLQGTRGKRGVTMAGEGEAGGEAEEEGRSAAERSASKK